MRDALLLRRLAALVPVLVTAVIVTFLAAHALPGDPIAAMLSDHSADTQMAARLRAEYGLDQPLATQFLRYVAGLASGDFGLSYRYVHQPVTRVIAESLTISPLLATAALALVLPVGVAVGIAAALARRRDADLLILLPLVLGLSVPNFAVATGLVHLTAVNLRLLPVAGWGRPEHLVLPVVVLALPSIAYVARLTRSFMLDVLGQDYIRTAHAKGLRERLVIGRHALRNILVPVLTSVGIIFGNLLSNTVVVETIFNIPGLGRLAIDSVFARDYPVVMAVVLLFTAFYALTNLAVDLLCAAIDPRLAYGGGHGRRD